MISPWHLRFFIFYVSKKTKTNKQKKKQQYQTVTSRRQLLVPWHFNASDPDAHEEHWNFGTRRYKCEWRGQKKKKAQRIMLLTHTLFCKAEQRPSETLWRLDSKRILWGGNYCQRDVPSELFCIFIALRILYIGYFFIYLCFFLFILSFFFSRNMLARASM